MLGTTLPTPMYGLYQEKFGFSVLVVTVIFAAYAAGVLAALMAFGRWSDTLGRRPLLLAGVVLAAISAVFFLVADSVWELLGGRVFSGLSAGIYVGAATVTVLETAPPQWRARAPFVATAVNIGGLGLGPLLAGLAVEFLPHPLQASFAAHLVLLSVAAIALAFVSETVKVAPHARPRLQRLSVPPVVRATFVRASIAGFAGFAVLGLFTAVAPTFLADVIGMGNRAVAGLVVFAVFAASAAAQIGFRSLPVAVSFNVGCSLLIAGMALVALALGRHSLAALVVGGIVAGAGQGMTFSKGVAEITASLHPDAKAEVASTFFVVVYVAISLPVIGVGLAAEVWGLVTAGLVFTTAVAVLAAVALAALARESRGTRKLPRHDTLRQT
ncbi:MAG: MFS transporter [Rhodococcus sp. (in: high G+C Gram-positive bacteria)]|uniref:MFS transporter n=1 Tax=Rhodococcus sp. TaxID=1831 RepID=UPI003BB14DFD